MKHIFIINPISGNQNGYYIGKQIKNYCSNNQLDHDIHYTSAPMDATNFAKLYKKDSHIIYAVGGDGTINEVVNGLVGTKNKLSIIPSGSGNDLYQYLKNQSEYEFKCDIGKINNKYFINIANIGIDAEIGHNATTIMRNKKIPSKHIYNASIFYTLFKYKYKYIDFELNNTKKNGLYTIIAICNGVYYGGGYQINPLGLLHDGLLDVYFVDYIPKFKLPPLILKLKKGLHIKSPHVHKRSVTHIKIKSKLPLICSVDGETMIDHKFNVKLIKNALTISFNQEMINTILKRCQND